MIFFFFFWQHPASCGILVPQPGIESGPWEVKAWGPNHWTTPGNSLLYVFLMLLSGLLTLLVIVSLTVTFCKELETGSLSWWPMPWFLLPLASHPISPCILLSDPLEVSHWSTLDLHSLLLSFPPTDFSTALYSYKETTTPFSSWHSNIWRPHYVITSPFSSSCPHLLNPVNRVNIPTSILRWIPRSPP